MTQSFNQFFRKDSRKGAEHAEIKLLVAFSAFFAMDGVYADIAWSKLSVLAPLRELLFN